MILEVTEVTALTLYWFLFVTLIHSTDPMISVSKHLHMRERTDFTECTKLLPYYYSK